MDAVVSVIAESGRTLGSSSTRIHTRIHTHTHTHTHTAYFKGEGSRVEEKAQARLRNRNVKGRGQGLVWLVSGVHLILLKFTPASVTFPFLCGVECWLQF